MNEDEFERLRDVELDIGYALAEIAEIASQVDSIVLDRLEGIEARLKEIETAVRFWDQQIVRTPVYAFDAPEA